jgi:hypothetical protein
MSGIEAARILADGMQSATLVLFTMHPEKIIGPIAREARFTAVNCKDQGTEALVAQGQILLEILSIVD